ncbi:hypothetical protein ACMXYX_05115 [Neptuniibacter sp. QD72_48]|uniref:hypothetical protein n=1 Tax=unclassified Neptuniibacter TaxID=2630693 RepID=UPI0039F5D36F
MCALRSSVLIAVTTLLTGLSIHTQADWYASFSTEYQPEAQSGHYAYKPLLQYTEGNFGTYLEYVYVPRNGLDNGKNLTWQVEYKWKLSENSSLKLVHEFDRTIDTNTESAELTPKFYTSFDNGLKAGFELEIDYYLDGDFDIYEIEIEPTLKWSRSLGEGKLNLELEAPTMRLYSNDDSIKDFEFEEVLPIIGYDHPLSKNLTLHTLLELPYDLQEDDFDTIITIGLGVTF